MKETLIIPTEKAPSLRQIKRALLTFDKVMLVDPEDRDIIPPNAFPGWLGLPMFGMSFGPVRPLGKVASHDADFQRLLDHIRPAQDQGLVQIVSSYDRETANKATLGAVLTGGYPLHPSFVMNVYRSIASNQELLSTVLDEDAFSVLTSPENLESLILAGVGDNTINDAALPMIHREGLSDDDALAMTSVARARLAAIIKFTGFCEAKDLVPTYNDIGYSRGISTLLTNTREFLGTQTTDPFWVRRNKVLDLSFDTMLEPHLLDDISVDDVIGMRTSEWGRFEELREALLDAVFELAQSTDNKEEFEKLVEERLVEIRTTAGEIESQRKSIDYKVKCDLGKGALGAGLSVSAALADSTPLSLLTLHAPLQSIGAFLAVGGIWALGRVKEYAPELIKLKQQEQDAKRGAGFAMSRFFTHIENKA